jgi:hypothetical protein
MEERPFSECRVSTPGVLSSISIVVNGSLVATTSMSFVRPELGIFWDASFVFGGVRLVFGLGLALPPGLELEPDRRQRFGVRAFEVAVWDRGWDVGFRVAKLPNVSLALSILGKSSVSSSLETVA